MPVKLRWNILRMVVVGLQFFGFEELLDRLFGLSRPPQIVTVHVMSMRNRRGCSYINLGLLQSFLRGAVIFKRMREVVVRGKIVGSQPQRGLIEGNGVHSSTLSVRGGRPFIRKSAQDPQPSVIRISGNCVV